MPLDLHANCRERLNKLVASALMDMRAKNGMFIERLSCAKLILADFALPQTGKLRDRLVEYIDEFPLAEFVIETIGQELWELDKYLPDQTVALGEVVEYADASSAANRLLDEFESLPWQYQVTVTLPEALNSILPPGSDAIELSPAIRIVRPTIAFDADYPLTHANTRRTRQMKGNPGLLSLLMSDTEAAKWDDNRIFIQVSAEGFIGQYGGSATAYKVERALRSFCGIGIATRLLKYEYAYSPSLWKPPAHVHRQTADGTWIPVTRYELSDSIARGMAGLKLHDLGGVLNTDEIRAGSITARLQDTAAIFRSGQRADQITLAAQWLFDSYCGQDQLLSFVQSMVVLEILLGDKSISDEIGIGELISNRFAYLIGTTHEERTELLEEFKKIDKVRSQIVHSGKHKLNLAENVLFSCLRWMCRRVIAKEVELLQAGLATPKAVLEKK
jgi:hypothetical protein